MRRGWRRFRGRLVHPTPGASNRNRRHGKAGHEQDREGAGEAAHIGQTLPPGEMSRRLRPDATKAAELASYHQMTAGAAPAGSFDELLGALLEPAYLLAVAMLGDRSLAEDAVQEASIKAWRGIHTVRDPNSLRSWFLSIVANQCRSLRRARWWSVRPLLSDVASVKSSPENVVVGGVDLTRALNRLPAEDRAVLLLHFYYDLTYDEVGRCMGLSMTAARSRIHRAAHRLRPGLELSDIG